MAVSAEPQQGKTVQQRRCASCDKPPTPTGSYCALCGQREFVGRHTLRAIVGRPLRTFLQVDRGFLHTAFRLTVTPGRVVRDYVGGRMAPYTHPGVYFLVSFAAFAVVASWRGAAGDLRFFFLPALVSITCVSRVIYWRAGFNLAEHLILSMYLYGHFALISVVLMTVGSVVSFPDLSLMPPIIGEWLFGEWVVGPAYFAWGYSRTFHRRPVPSALGGIAAFLLGYGLWLAGFIAVGFAFGS